MADVEVCSEIAGTVWKIVTQQGAAVSDGDELMILESMKMEIPVSAPRNGKVAQICVAEGDVVAEGQVLAVIGS